jgi:ATP-dependent Lon protease
MEQIPAVLPVLPIRNAVLFPSISMPLVVGRDRSIRALEAAEATNSLVIVVAQRVLTPGDPAIDDLYRTGTLCKIENITPTDTGSRQIVVTGIARFQVEEYGLIELGSEGGLYLSSRGQAISDILGDDPVRRDALFYNLKEVSREILELLPGATDPLVKLIERVDDPGYLTNVCAGYLNLALPQKQELLETIEVEARMDLLLAHMRKEREVLNLQGEIRDKMAERLNKAQREALLREQLRTIRTELGEEGTEESVDEIEYKIRDARLPAEARKQADDELKRLRALPQSSAEHHVIRTYLEWIAALPWGKRSEDRIDLTHARATLDGDHYGLESVKKRMLQFLAVAKLKNDLHGPILCLVGPPGVGKTSLGQSIASALERKFVRASLGGVRDEAEIRGHRRTYVGAMPGRIIQGMKRAGTSNPVMLLDEIDKLRTDFHGDPSAAMLEVLDPEQNKSFTDHYLDLPYDLSDVFFIATANQLDTIPAALRDRMEIIEVNGYTSQEKLEIARRHIEPRLLKEHGLQKAWVDFPDDALIALIAHYTREAGVRDLQRKIAALFRAAAEEIVQKRAGAPLVVVAASDPLPSPGVVRLTRDRLRPILGPERFQPEIAEQTARPGVATGLAWTPHGGDILHLEVTALPKGHGVLTLTGQLGDVMKESAQIAVSLARATVSRHFGLEGAFDFAIHDLHIHVPAGAIPKDGPSAGVTLFSALASLIIGRPLRTSLAMTGEITLRGAVLPVGGIKEKIIAAHRAELRTVILPKRNEQDLEEVPAEIRRDMRFVLASTVEEVLATALEPAIRLKVSHTSTGISQ